MIISPDYVLLVPSGWPAQESEDALCFLPGRFVKLCALRGGGEKKKESELHPDKDNCSVVVTIFPPFICLDFLMS